MLREVQQDFMRGLLDGQAISGIEPSAALSVYTNTVRVNFTESLRRTYPVVWRLVGEDYFRQCARDYHERYPSRSGDLQYVGSRFSDYLSTLHSGDGYSYLADVALLEWTYQEASSERAIAPLEITRLAVLQPEQYSDLRFRLQPSARLMESPFPVLVIWRANLGASNDASAELAVDLTCGADRLLLVRTDSEVGVHRLQVGEVSLLQGLKAHDTLAAAIEAACEADPKFDPSASLQKWVALGVIVDFYSKEIVV